jgi:hypothetical protein
LGVPSALGRFLAGAVLSVALAVTVAFAQDQSLEYAVKATYLYKLGPFIEWPGVSPNDPAMTFKICIVGRDPFGQVLDRAVSGRLIANRKIVIIRLPLARSEDGCHVMYLTESSEQSVADALRAMKGQPILTVTENGVASEEKGIVNFVIRDNRVRFEIDDQAAAENGITISSKVLDLAVHVKRRAA